MVEMITILKTVYRRAVNTLNLTNATGIRFQCRFAFVAVQHSHYVYTLGADCHLDPNYENPNYSKPFFGNLNDVLKQRPTLS